SKGGGSFCFFYNQIRHCLFSYCTFENVTIFESIVENVQFNQCTFKNVRFDPNAYGVFKNLLFQSCKFEDCNFERVSINQISFFGNSKEIINSKFNLDSISDYDIFNNFNKTFIKWDKESWPLRKRIKSRTPSNRSTVPKINYFKKFEKRNNKKSKYYTRDLIWQGSIQLFQYLLNNYLYKEHSNLFFKSQYIISWYQDDLIKSRVYIFKKILARYILSYGYKPKNPLLTWIIINIIFSFAYLFSGITYIDKPIKRFFLFDLSQFINTSYDFLKCLYFSFITK
ncbi:MAG: hypothetical protein ACFFDN_46890, partial [Candidatus Hodarchaeota archaeon]